VRKLLRYGEIIDRLSSDKSLNNLLTFIAKVTHEVVDRHHSEGVILAGLVGDNGMHPVLTGGLYKL
jgi:hypothetical protein